MGYQMKHEIARLGHSDYILSIVDGTDPSSFDLPHFTTSTEAKIRHN